ncbi:TPA: hypothetical protein ACRZLE_005233 [Escherichia coli]|nr:hypothetical protein [Escherichia coli]MDM4910602.1 hypothetical protein [Escherichia coli]MDM4981263.1 hypothetical protein [Escherichia coli]
MSVKLTIVFTDLGNNQCHNLIRVENGDNATLELWGLSALFVRF